MGCIESKNEKEEEEEAALSPFKNRMHLINDAVLSRNAFFAAISAYAICVKNTGASFTDGIHPHPNPHPSAVDILPSPPRPSPSPPLSPPPPPPFPSFKSSYPLTRAFRMPETKPDLLAATIMEEDELELEAEELTRKPTSIRPSDTNTRYGPPLQMHQGSAWDYFFPVEKIVENEEVNLQLPVPVRPLVKKPVSELAMRRISRQPVSLMQIFGDLDIHFLNAFDSILKFSQLFNSHSNFDDNQPNNEHIEKIQTLATVLNKLLVWETKLYDQIKVGEVIKYDYQKKVSLLNKQKKQTTTNPNSFEKLKASITHLRTRYVVEMQSAVSTAAKINRIRDEQLYPQLVQLVDGMAKMWKTMLLQHESQLNIVLPLKSLDEPQSMSESSKYRYDCTIQLCGAVRGWHTQFCGIIEYQKDLIRALHRWLKLTLIPIATNLEENVSSSLPRVQNAPIHELVIAWKNDLDQLPDEAARNVISNFADVIRTIVHEQEKDLKLRKSCEAIPKELDRKSTNKEEIDPVIISLKQRLEDNEEVCETIRKPAAKNKTLATLKHSLPDFFRALLEIAQACSGMYHNLRNIAENQHKEVEREQKAAAVDKKKDDFKPDSIYKMKMHCEGCAKKVRNIVKRLGGVEAVKTDCEANKLMVRGKVDPARVKARLEEKAKRKVDIVFPQTKKDGSGGDKAISIPLHIQLQEPRGLENTQRMGICYTEDRKGCTK